MFSDPAFNDVPGMPALLPSVLLTLVFSQFSPPTGLPNDLDDNDDGAPATDLGRFYELEKSKEAQDITEEDITAAKVPKQKARRSKLEIQLIKLNKLARGHVELESSGDEESEEEEEESDAEAEIKPEIDLKPEYREEETSRLALVNCDWDHLRAVDIFAILKVLCVCFS